MLLKFFRAEVYSAMAESLGLAWKDLNNLLEQRKIILDQNYLFQGHFQVIIQFCDNCKQFIYNVTRNVNRFFGIFSFLILKFV